MDRVLEKLVKTLNEYDESSLMSLWPKYAAAVMDFEPTKRWEEAALTLCLIQAVLWKNQLFNYQLTSESAADELDDIPEPTLPYFLTDIPAGPQPPQKKKQHKAKILSFPEKTPPPADDE